MVLSILVDNESSSSFFFRNVEGSVCNDRASRAAVSAHGIFPHRLRWSKSRCFPSISWNPPAEFLQFPKVYFISRCAACVQRKVPKETLFLEHVRNVAKAVRDQHGLKAIIWDDMLRGVTPAQIEVDQDFFPQRMTPFYKLRCSVSESGLDQLVEVMVWEYHDLNKVPPSKTHLVWLSFCFFPLFLRMVFLRYRPHGTVSQCFPRRVVRERLQRRHQFLSDGDTNWISRRKPFPVAVCARRLRSRSQRLGPHGLVTVRFFSAELFFSLYRHCTVKFTK